MWSVRPHGRKKSPPIDGLIDGGFFDFRTLQVIRLRHVFKSLTCRYPSSLLWEDSHESLSQRARDRAVPLPGCCHRGQQPLLFGGPTYIPLRVVRRLR